MRYEIPFLLVCSVTVFALRGLVPTTKRPSYQLESFAQLVQDY
jgi:hypothetical protein